MQHTGFFKVKTMIFIQKVATRQEFTEIIYISKSMIYYLNTQGEIDQIGMRKYL